MSCCQRSLVANQKEGRPPSDKHTTAAEIADGWQSADEEESRKQTKTEEWQKIIACKWLPNALSST